MKDDRLLQNIAMEMNLSETAFLCKQDGEYKLRWFSPETEVQFCGHATLSAAHILWETGAEQKQTTIQFDADRKALRPVKAGQSRAGFSGF